MALADLVAALKAEAAEQRTVALAEARARARRIRTEAEAAAERTRTESLARAEREERDDARRAVARARMDASTRVLGARARLLERVRRSVERRIAEAPADAAYVATLPDELSAALARMPAGPVEAHVSEGLGDALEAASAAFDTVRVVRVPDGPVGYTLRGADGAVEVDATLPARLELRWPRLAMRLLREVDA
jgi:vacuolar-type H+-ATPase subunit E/Vma4